MRHLKKAKNQLTLTRARITKLTKELEQKVTEMSKVKKAEYDLGKNEIEAHLKSQILAVCRGFCLRTWTKALNVAGVDPFSELRNLEKVFYPSASLCFILLCHNCPCSAYPGRRPTFQTKRGGHNNLRYSKKDSCSRQCPLLV